MPRHLFVSPHFTTGGLCLGKRGWWNRAKKGGLLEIFIAMLLVGWVSIDLFLILFQAKVILIDETTVSRHIRAKL